MGTSEPEFSKTFSRIDGKSAPPGINMRGKKLYENAKISGFQFPDQDHVGSQKPPFRIGFYLVFSIRDPGWFLPGPWVAQGIMSDGRKMHCHKELLVQIDFRRNGMMEGTRMIFIFIFHFFNSGQLLSPRRRPAGPRFPLPRAANEPRGAACEISVAT